MTICSRWWVQYNDGGVGEDFLNTNQWAHQGASETYAYVIDQSWNVYWQGNLDGYGCAWGITLPPGTYGLFQVT